MDSQKRDEFREVDDIFDYWQNEISAMMLNNNDNETSKTVKVKSPNEIQLIDSTINYSADYTKDEDDEFDLGLLNNIVILKERNLQNASISTIEKNFTKPDGNGYKRRFQLTDLDTSEDFDVLPQLINEQFVSQTARSMAMKSIVNLNSKAFLGEKNYKSHNKLYAPASEYTKFSVSQSKLSHRDGESSYRQSLQKNSLPTIQYNHIETDEFQQKDSNNHQHQKTNASFIDQASESQLNSLAGTLNTESQHQDAYIDNQIITIFDEDFEKIIKVAEVYQNRDYYSPTLRKLHERKYRVESFLAKGKGGIYFSGYHSQNNEQIVIKFSNFSDQSNKMSAKTLNNIQKSMDDEKNTLRELDHLSVISKIKDQWICDRIITQVMERQKQDISVYFQNQQNTPISVQQVGNLFLQLTNALVSLHANGIKHMNIKPGNILIDENNNIKFSDFEISKKFFNSIDSTHSSDLNLYNSPEQEHQLNSTLIELDIEENCDEKSDIFSLGLIFLQILGTDLTERQVTQIKRGHIDQIYQSSKQYTNLYSLVIYYMLCTNPKQRVPALLLQQQLMNVIEKYINVEEETQKIKKLIDQYKGQQQFKRYLIFLYCMQAQIQTDNSLKHQFLYSSIIVSKQVKDFCPIDSFYLSCLYAYYLLKSGHRSRGESLLEENFNSLQQISYTTKLIEIAYSIFILGESCLFLDKTKQALQFHLSSLQLKEQLYKSVSHIDIAVSLDRVSEIYLKMGNTQKSLAYYLRALNMREQLVVDSNQEISDIQIKIGDLYFKFKEYKNSFQYYNRALFLKENFAELNKSDIVNTSFNIGKALIKLNDFAGSIKYFDKALALCDKFRQEKLFDVPLLQRWLSFVHFKLGNKLESLDYFISSFQAGKPTFHFDSLDNADSLIFIAQIYERLGSKTKSIDYYQQSIKLREQTGQKEHINIAKALNHIGRLYQKQAQYPKAIQYGMLALLMSQKLYTKNHPQIIMALKTLGFSYFSLSQYKHAFEQYSQILELQEKFEAEKQTDIIETLLKLGKIQEKSGELLIAIDYNLKVLEKREKLYKGDHKDIAESYNAIGQLYYKLHNFYRAKQNFANNLAMRKRLDKEENNELIESLNNMSIVCNRLRDYNNSKNYCKQVLEMTQRLYKTDHPYIVRALQNLAILFSEQKDHLQSIEYYQQALEMQQRLYPEGHIDLGVIMHQIGLQYSLLKNYQQSSDYHIKAIQMLEKFKSSKPNHSAYNFFSLAQTLSKQGNEEKAGEYYQKALKITESLFS